MTQSHVAQQYFQPYSFRKNHEWQSLDVHLLPWRRISSSTVGRYSRSPQASSLSAVSSRAGADSCKRHLKSWALAGAPNREGSSGARRKASSVPLQFSAD